MSQNTLLEKIKTDADKKVQEIKARSSKEVSAIESEVETEIKKLKENHQKNLEKAKAHQELVTISKAKQAGKIAIQKAKREEIDSIFSEVSEELASQDSDEYVSFFYKHTRQTLPEKVEIVKVQAPENRKEETEKILTKAELEGKIEASSEIKAGLIIKTSDGVYDITLGRIIDEARADLEMMIVEKVMS